MTALVAAAILPFGQEMARNVSTNCESLHGGSIMSQVLPQFSVLFKYKKQFSCSQC